MKFGVWGIEGVDRCERITEGELIVFRYRFDIGSGGEGRGKAILKFLDWELKMC